MTNQRIYMYSLVMTPILKDMWGNLICVLAVFPIFGVVTIQRKEIKESEIDHRYQFYTEKNVPDNKMENS